MELSDPKMAVGGGRAAAGGSSFYHLSFRSGSRASGACARAACDYVTRQDEYGEPDRDPAVYIESDHMPVWAADDPSAYWDAADLYERENGRLYVSADLALPRELAVEDQIALAREFAHELTDDERLPYTLAVHAGRDRDGNAHNPHAHLMFSERRNDGIDRSRDRWFRRASSAHPERGGAPKSRTFHGSGWVERAREGWATLTNDALTRAGRCERVDHRSYERQGLDRVATSHYGPAAPHMAGGGVCHERLDATAQVMADRTSLRALDAEIERVEALREAVLRHGIPDEEPTRDARNDSASRDHSFER